MRRKTMAMGAAAIGLAAGIRRLLREPYHFAGRSVLVTGGSRGLGLVLAREMAREGARLTIVARDDDELGRAAEELRSGGADVLAIPCDVTDAEQVERTVEAAVHHHGGLDVLINNAGAIQVGPVENMSVEDLRESLDIHLWAAVHTVRASLTHLSRHRDGRIVNIASIGGKLAVPHLLPYSVGKFALVGFSEGLRHELLRYGVRVTTVCPGLMRTGSHLRAEVRGQHEKEYGWFATMASLPVTSIDARRAARQILDACRRGDAELVIATQARLAVIANAVCPNLVSDVLGWVARALPDPAGPDGDFPRIGLESRTAWTGPLTTMGDRAAVENKEI
jgi:NAD(P)-dependent dehydrogenase (short-subunit alcohol dehydrogenase family)